jgi:hypothetical protein
MFKTYNSNTKQLKNNLNLSPIKHFKLKKLLNNIPNKYAENHTKNSFELKKSLSSFKTEYEHFNNDQVKTNKYGFKSFQVPRIDNIDSKKNDQSMSLPVSPRLKLINSKMIKSLSKGDFYEENEKMKEILNTNRQKELLSSFPNINNILNQNHIKNVQLNLKNNKIMGEKYDPFNYRLDLFKSNIRRNSYGALYQH